MKNTVLTLLLLALALPVSNAQTVIKYRRPMRALGIEGGVGMSVVSNENRVLGGLQQQPVKMYPAGGITFEGPMNFSLDIVLKLRYSNKSFVCAPEGDSLPSHNIHAVMMDVGANWYPFHNIFYMGAYFTFGGNVLAHRIDADGTWTKLKSSDLDALGLFLSADGTWTKLKSSDLDALGLFLSYGLEAGFSLGYWPIGDRITIFARWEQDWSGSPFTKYSESIYRNELVYNKKMRLGSVTAGVRIPIILIRD